MTGRDPLGLGDRLAQPASDAEPVLDNLIQRKLGGHTEGFGLRLIRAAMPRTAT